SRRPPGARDRGLVVLARDNLASGRKVVSSCSWGVSCRSACDGPATGGRPAGASVKTGIIKELVGHAPKGECGGDQRLQLENIRSGQGSEGEVRRAGDQRLQLQHIRGGHSGKGKARSDRTHDRILRSRGAKRGVA